MKNAFCKFKTSKALHIAQVHRANKLDMLTPQPCVLHSLSFQYCLPCSDDKQHVRSQI